MSVMRGLCTKGCGKPVLASQRFGIADGKVFHIDCECPTLGAYEVVQTEVERKTGEGRTKHIRTTFVQRWIKSV